MEPRQTPGTGAASTSALPFVLGVGLAFGLVRLVLRKRRDDSAAAGTAVAAPAPRAAPPGSASHHRHHRTGA
ncbi:hypothetical protein [Arthrobacter sp. JSM 101049]|uniref:hypothetical protein n=1 Tax=Arthrobacter sp. JSM 101049 TaxID=929097 RepID=UPI003562ADC7